jgi:arylsulfatase B
MMDLCGIDPEKYKMLNLHGKSLKPLLTEKSPPWPARTITTDSQRLPNPVKWRQSAVMTDQWRLINGSELYDATTDKEQRHDIADQHRDIVLQLRDEYEKWWELVSGKFDEEIPISIGSEDEEETCLRSHDWRPLGNPHETNPFVPEDNAYIVFDQKQVRQGLGKNGYLEILVEKTGRYRIEMRRWPREEDRPIIQGIEDSGLGWRSDILGDYREAYSGGKALPFTEARLEIGNEVWEKQIRPEDKGVCFEVNLKQGPAHLCSTFLGKGQLSLGAYYVYIKMIL